MPDEGWIPAYWMKASINSVDLPDIMGDIPDTMGDLLDTTGDLPDIMDDLPDTMVDFPDTIGGLRDTQSCKNLGSVVALLQGNFEKSHDFKANFEEKRAVLMCLQKLDDNFLQINSVIKLMSKTPKTFDDTHTFHGQT